MAHILHGPSTLYCLHMDCKRIIFEEMVRETARIPGRAILRPRPRALVSLLRVCSRIRNEVIDEKRRLMDRYLKVNTFSFNSLSALDAVVARAPQANLDKVQSVHVEEYSIKHYCDISVSWQTLSAQCQSLLRLPALRHLSMQTGPIHNFRSYLHHTWASTDKSMTRQRHEQCIDRIIFRLPALPIGLTVDVHTELPAAMLLHSEKGWVSDGPFLVTLSKTRIGPGVG